jgi:MoxR-like ATPase
MAQDPRGARYYTERDVRSFVAGLSVSRLHILQGISGTGKTSLPRSFAHAVGAGSKVIEVQAGWRDRQDLLGHYNAFERKYYETEFLKALYKAQLPAYADRLFFIILDEMNLSRPEQYFADLLSALELSPGERRLNLVPSETMNAPERIIHGTSIAIPENLWFIGTANHDETTVEFADKTYDRSHIMELPNKPERFPTKALPEKNPLSASALQRHFKEIHEKRHQDGEKAFAFINNVLAEPMRDRFGIAWANRLERYVLGFVPVVLEAGGTLSDAVDDVISMKILRKIRNRHDTVPTDLKAVRDELMTAWNKTIGSAAAPQRSLDIIDREVARLGGSYRVA